VILLAALLEKTKFQDANTLKSLATMEINVLPIIAMFLLENVFMLLTTVKFALPLKIVSLGLKLKILKLPVKNLIARTTIVE